MFPGASLIVTIINLFILVLIVRAIFSWFPGMLYTQAGRTDEARCDLLSHIVPHNRLLFIDLIDCSCCACSKRTGT